ncbi:MAG: MmcQ/YjbR family DNA-binding protein [Bacteroidetes bacterium]|jgi:predicted DNA-binding protein (MmcQ/YjbR family)|nr:MmcQ/YjbR family DNA-binding protein [Bacteroidota bacterium]
MDLEFLREYCLKKPHTTEETPFGLDPLVFKVHGKMFALCSIENFVSISLKCDPDKAEELRATYTAVNAGYHMNKKHWNTVTVNQDVDDSLLLTMVDDSFALVVKSLPKKLQATIG